VDDDTRAIYEANAVEWTQRRSPRELDAAHALVVDRQGPSLDLGCGPGWYAPALPGRVVALDAAYTMLALTRDNAPHASRVQADLERLPFRRGSFGLVWARHSLVHVPRAALPLALADLHGGLRVGGTAVLSLFIGDGEGHAVFADDDFPGRFFAQWDADALIDVVRGAGFAVDSIASTTSAVGEQSMRIVATRTRTLPDLVAAGMRVLICGLNPSLRAADAGIGFVTPGNRFWPALLAAGLASVDRDPEHALRQHRIGFTDLVKRASVSAKDVTRAEYADGFARVERVVEWLQPSVVCFVGLSGWRAAVDRRAVAGLQPRTLGGRPVYVMPNTSGLNARVPLADFVEHLRAAVALA
jgi:TDG/mug DNA glycosylase family protein